LALAGSERSALFVEQTKENTFQILSGKENLKRMRLEIEKNIKTYHVRKGDTIASISNRAGVGMDQLIDLNIFLGRSLERR